MVRSSLRQRVVGAVEHGRAEAGQKQVGALAAHKIDRVHKADRAAQVVVVVLERGEVRELAGRVDQFAAERRAAAVRQAADRRDRSDGHPGGGNDPDLPPAMSRVSQSRSQRATGIGSMGEKRSQTLS